MMTSHFRSKQILVAVAAAALTYCGGGGSGPSDDELADFIIGLTASDGSVATARAGAPPAPTGGPGLTVTSSGSVTSGGNDIVRLRAASPFSKVYVDVSGTTGHYELALAASTVDVTVTARLAGDIPDNSYLAGYRAASPGGLVGTPSTVNNTVAAPPAAGSTNVTGTWSSGGSPLFSLSQSGSSVTGTYIFPAFPADPTFTISFSGPITGTVSGNTVNLTANFSFIGTAPGLGTLFSCSQVSTYTATVSGNTMTGNYAGGTFTCVSNEIGFPSTFAGSSGPFTATR